MFVRILAVTVAVLAAPAAALAHTDHPGEKADGAPTASTGSHSSAAKADSAGHSHAKGVTPNAATDAAHAAHDMAPTKVTVAELAAKLVATPPAVVVDANDEKTRAKEGMIPGAKLLTSASQYDPAKELGTAKDADLVFYCANTRCTASHTAAMRAINAGYTHVSILPEGIAGWKAAGKTTSPVPRS